MVRQAARPGDGRRLRTAIDTSVLSALWSREPLAHTLGSQLGQAKQEGGLLISAVVFAELLAYPGITEHFINGFLEETGITIDFHLEKKAWMEAGRRFASHADRRRRSAHFDMKRFLADFLVGSHALFHADRLMTLDKTRYRKDFPELRLV